jgi:hypothetical protein
MYITYCRGGDPLAPFVARFAGMHYGIRHDYIPYAPIWMLDIHWKNYDWGDYLSKVNTYRPYLAMVPDYEIPDKPRLLQRIADVYGAGAQQVMVCPKFDGAVADIPARCWVAISVPTDYAGFLPHCDEVRGRYLHLLGGEPDQHLYLMRYRYPDAQIISVDYNGFTMQAGLGKYWHSTRADWTQTPSHQYSTLALTLASAWHIKRYLFNPNSHIWFNRIPVQKCVGVRQEAFA